MIHLITADNLGVVTEAPADGPEEMRLTFLQFQGQSFVWNVIKLNSFHVRELSWTQIPDKKGGTDLFELGFWIHSLVTYVVMSNICILQTIVTAWY